MMRRGLIALCCVLALPVLTFAQQVAPEGEVELRQDDPSLPDRMRVMLAQTEGVGRRIIPETVIVAADLMEAGDLISVQQVYSKTGVITADYRSRSILTGSISIPAGTPIFAEVFTQLAPNGLPLQGMWCASGYRGPVTDVGERGVCFAGANGRAVFWPVARAQSPYAVTSFEMSNFHHGEFPQIELRPLPDDIVVRQYFVVDEVDGSGLRFHTEVGEAHRRTSTRSGVIALTNGEGIVPFFGGEFRVEVIDRRVRAIQISPIQPLDTTLHWRVARESDGGFVMTAGPLRYQRNGETETFTDTTRTPRQLPPRQSP